MDEIFDFNELIFRIIRRWRFIISFAVILAVLAAGYQAYSQGKGMNASDNEQQQRIDKLNSYISESIRMKIDPYSECTSSITFLVRSDTLDRDRATDVAMLYMRLHNDDGLYEKIKSDVGLNIDSDYFRELICWPASSIPPVSFTTTTAAMPISYAPISYTPSTSFEVRVIGHTPELAQTIAESVTGYYAEQHRSISQYMGEHSLEVVSKGEYFAVNPDQKIYQDGIRNGLKKLRAENPAGFNAPVNAKTVLMWSALYAAIGGVFGIGISVLLLLFLDSVRMAVLSDKDVSKKYNLRFLGSVSKGEK